MNKTGRKRGEIYRFILAAAEILGEFEPAMLTPALTYEQARRNCDSLATKGRLRRLQAGTPGRNGKKLLFASAIGSDAVPAHPGGRCLICGSTMLLQIWRGHRDNQKVHCNHCGSEVTLLVHRQEQITERSHGEKDTL